MSKILRCKKCGDIIQSTHRHDMVWCKCGAVAIDGGDDYCKVSGNLDDMEFLVSERLFPINDDKHSRRNPPKAVEVLKKYINLIEDIYYYTTKYINDTEIELIKYFDKLLDQLDELLERKEKEMKSE